jgi:hypothetical protein
LIVARQRPNGLSEHIHFLSTRRQYLFHKCG